MAFATLASSPPLILNHDTIGAHSLRGAPGETAASVSNASSRYGTGAEQRVPDSSSVVWAATCGAAVACACVGASRRRRPACRNSYVTRQAVLQDVHEDATSDVKAEADAGVAAKAKAKPDGGRRTGTVKPGERKKRSKKLSLKPVRGTRDFYPAEMRRQTWLFSLWREVAQEFGFVEYDAPVLENLELYLRKAGEEIVDQLYNFVDKGDREVALRPEMTPSLARMVLAQSRQLIFPLKWYSIPQCWRYERPGKGRNREHYQWNMDIWGVEGVSAEAELLAAITTFMKKTGLTAADVKIRVNSRKIISEVLAKSNVPDDLFNEACVALDKFDKLSREDLLNELLEAGLSQNSADALLGYIDDVADMTDPSALEKVLGSESAALEELTTLFELAKSYGYRDWLVPDLSVVRGLAYYTGVVFEAFDRQGDFRAITGGGRYDKLLDSFGGKSVPAVGFGFGDAVIIELLAARGLLPADPGPGIEIVVFVQEAALYGPAAEVATTLRQSGWSTELILEPKKMRPALKQANRIKAQHVVILAGDEWQDRQVVVKTLETGDQQTVPVSDILEALSSAPRR